MSRRARLARLEAALLVDTGDLCLKCTELANPEEFRWRMRAMVERAKTNPEPRQVLNSEKLAAHFAELRRLTAPCP